MVDFRSRELARKWRGTKPNNGIRRYRAVARNRRFLTVDLRARESCRCDLHRGNSLGLRSGRRGSRFKSGQPDSRVLVRAVICASNSSATRTDGAQMAQNKFRVRCEISSGAWPARENAIRRHDPERRRDQTDIRVTLAGDSETHQAAQCCVTRSTHWWTAVSSSAAHYFRQFGPRWCQQQLVTLHRKRSNAHNQLGDRDIGERRIPFLQATS